MKVIAVMTVLIFLSITTTALAFEDANTVVWTDVPPAVQFTISQNVHGGTIDGVEKVTRDGQLAYGAVVTTSFNESFKLIVTPEGILIDLRKNSADQAAALNAITPAAGTPTSDACTPDAYSPQEYAFCKDLIQKIQRMMDAQEQREQTNNNVNGYVNSYGR